MSKSLDHIAFIMDGNGRWAKARKLKRTDGHLEGTKRIPEVIDRCIEHKIKYISFFCFSTENWQRPKNEINFLIKKFTSSLSEKNLNWFNERNIKVNFIGFKENMPKNAFKKVHEFCNKTKSNNKFIVNFFFNYGSQQEILNACKELLKSGLTINKKNFEKFLLTNNLPDVDLLIRTSGEERISNFLLWQIAYAEIIFEKTMWPDYKTKVLDKNINEYNKRNRRFGAI